MYDAADRLTSRTDRNGRTITFGYDHLGRQTSRNWLTNGVSVNTITTTYNGSLMVSSITDNDSALAFTWDSLGRLTSSSNAGTLNAPSVTVNLSYDSLGRRSSQSATINGIADFVNSYAFDSAGRMNRITQTDGNASAGYAVKDKRVDLSYDAAGRFSAINRYESLAATNAVAVSNYGYDSAGRLSSLQHVGYGNSVTGQPDTSSIAGYTFSWNAADQLTSINSVRDGLTNYSYDATSQLTGADYASQTDETFTYDANGNRTSVARVSDAGTSSFSSTATAHNRILNDGTSTYTYDAEGNRTSKTEIATGSMVEYQWNHANLLTAVI